jgi:hypothetical protein
MIYFFYYMLKFFYRIEIICNPRGRPEDFNRENYIIKKIEL